MINNLEVVYYSEPVTSTLKSLALLGLVYDKVYFPGVFIPNKGVDEKEATEIVKNFRLSEQKDYNQILTIRCIQFAINYKFIKDFCVFTGKYGYLGTLEDGAEELSDDLEKIIFGKPPENFYPTYASGLSISLPGDNEVSVNFPSWLTYPPNALIYALKNSIPLINDNPSLPMPSAGIDINQSPKSNAKILSQILALECVKLILPDLKIQSFEEISILRENTKDYVKPFRLKMLELCEFLNSNITSKTNMKETIKEVKFIADTKVFPEIIRLEDYIKNKSKNWFKRLIFDFGASVPEISANFITMPPNFALAASLSKVGAVFIQSLFNIYEDKRDLVKNGFYYLLKLKK